MKLFKQKSGFTLIELLVVIGILAVLAAIAIPSVAGLIDRANVSADNTNANEMTNAMERFASEYELYCQDVASGLIKDENGDGIPDNMDAAQSRVFNVTGAKNRNDITALESPSGLNAKIIDRDTKYPSNATTLTAIVENYTKTSSATFEPKQSDMHFWYSPACGVVVVATPDSSVADKNALVVSGKDAKGRELDDTNEIWVDITQFKSNYVAHNSVIPSGGRYVKADGTEYREGEPFPAINEKGDKYYYGVYRYQYGPTTQGWMVGLNTEVTDKNQETYPEILREINGRPITSMYATFAGCIRLKTPPTIPETVVAMNATFQGCTKLIDLSNYIIPDGVKYMGEIEDSYVGAFYGCKNLQYAPKLPAGLVTMNQTFANCTSLVEKPEIPAIFDPQNVFRGCTQFGY